MGIIFSFGHGDMAKTVQDRTGDEGELQGSDPSGLM